MTLFRNKYRIESTRLKNWDYSSNGAYFITICTKNREHYFGEIQNGEMQLNEIGQLVEKFWSEIPNHFEFVELGNFVIMPNHTHGILIIYKTENLAETSKWVNKEVTAKMVEIVETPEMVELVETPKLGVSTNSVIPNPKKIGGKNEFWKPGTIGVIINQFKRVVTINARKINPDFEWQTRFHEIIIRNAKSFQRIQTYIKNNPSKWKEDNFKN